MNLINEAEIRDTWSPIIESATGITESAKLGWMSTYCHNHKLYEDANIMSLSNNPGPMNLTGMGAVSFPAGAPANGAADAAKGSGDKAPTLLPLAMQVAAQTIGLDLVPVVPMAGPMGLLSYLDFTYQGGSTSTTSSPDYIKLTATGTGADVAADLGTGATKHAGYEYIGDSRIDGKRIYKVLNDVQGTATNVAADVKIALDGASPSAALNEFDDIIDELDANGAIEENMLFLDRKTSLSLDDMLAGISDGAQGGTSFGVFNNEEDMALNLGFSGFRRGSYDFYKTDWKYLNDATTRGLVGDIEGVVVPAGTSTVYDQMLGKNISRPFLHIRYRASEADDRKMKSWITGSVGGNFTSDLDSMTVNFLSERCLCVQAANNFVLLKKV